MGVRPAEPHGLAHRPPTGTQTLHTRPSSLTCISSPPYLAFNLAAVRTDWACGSVFTWQGRGTVSRIRSSKVYMLSAEGQSRKPSS